MLFRKIRRPTPYFKVPPPYNPVAGDHATLHYEGTYPYCSMMQVAREDTFEHHVVCRGFDTRIAKFVDYEENNSEKPGISVAKLFGSRGTEKYLIGQGAARKFRVGEIFPAFLPAQGVGQMLEKGVGSYTPPSPVGVPWRVGQNPGYAVVPGDKGIWGGHPENLGDEIPILYDHNGKAVNWMFIHSDTERKFRFQSQEDLTGTSVSACVRQMNGEDPHIADIHDPDGIFAGMQAGTKGLVFFQEGFYYIFQAKCDPDEILPCEEEEGGGDGGGDGGGGGGPGEEPQSI